MSRARVHKATRRPRDRLGFAPRFAPRVISAPAHAFVNERVPLDAVWRGSLVRQVEDAWAASDDPGAALEELALDTSEPGAPHERLVDRIVDRVRAAVPVARIAYEVGLSAVTRSATDPRHSRACCA